MMGQEFKGIIRAFDRVPAIGGTYFRLVETGFQPVDLHPTSPKPLIGIGKRFRAGMTVAEMELELPERVETLLAKRSGAKASPEKRVEAAAVRGALTSNLRLEGLGADLRFVASQWRLDLGDKAEVLDLLAIDLKTAGLVVIELKPKPDLAGKDQASRYAGILRQHDPATGPFFEELGRAMARLYGCDDLPRLVPGLVTGIAAWPIDERGTYEVVHCP